jgi:hypothetical protein
MADLKISQLTGASTPLAGTEVVPLVQSSTTKKVSVANLTAGRTVQMSSLDANGGSSTGGAIVSGSVPAIRASSTVVDIGDGHRYLALGANASTPGVIKLISASSDASIYQYLLTSDTSYNLTFNTGNLIQGTAAKGVNFTANTPAAGMTSQLLNWYEEGLYTATLTCSVSGTITVDSNFNTLAYTRVGRLVTVSGGIRVSAVSSPTGAVVLNLPFTSANLNKEAGLSVGTMVAVNLGAYSQPLSMYVIESAADAYIQYMNSGTRTSVPGSDFSGDEELVFCITYLAA